MRHENKDYYFIDIHPDKHMLPWTGIHPLQTLPRRRHRRRAAVHPHGSIFPAQGGRSEMPQLVGTAAIQVRSIIHTLFRHHLSAETFHPQDATRRHRQQVVPLRTYGNSLQRSHRAAQGVRQDQSVDQRGWIHRGHDNRRGPRQTKPSPLGGCCYRSRHRFHLRTGKLLDSGQNHRKVQNEKEGCRRQHHRRGTEDTNRCNSRRTCNGNKAITTAIKPV